MSGQSNTKDGLFAKAYEIIGQLTPLEGHDCGRLCERACCAGDKDSGTGMLLFPGEPSNLDVIENENGRFAVCGGSCDREERPLACRIFPLYPGIDDDGEVTAMIDGRGTRLCPLVRCCDDVLFDERFLDAVEEVGRLLAGDEECASAMRQTTEEIERVNMLVFGEEEGNEE